MNVKYEAVNIHFHKYSIHGKPL